MPTAKPPEPGEPRIAVTDWIRAHLDTLPAEARTVFAREFAAVRATAATWEHHWATWFHGAKGE